MEIAKTYRGRFAPSPTGPLHLGSLLAAMGSWLMARQAGGNWLIRIEDIDPPREISGAAKSQIETLKAFGMESDEKILWQSQRSERYSEVLKTLLDSDRAFECFCSRKDLAEHHGVHRFCVARNPEKNPAIRLRIPEITIDFEDRIQGTYSQAIGSDVGDIVIKRADGFWAYQLAVVVDDFDQGITHIVRGQDLISSTPRQIFLQRIFGYQTPLYAHLPLVVDADGLKLSKSLSAIPIDPNDPIPAMRWIWQYLGQNEAYWPLHGKPEHVLLHALTHFDAGLIPASSQMITALQF
ncbi:MAG: tRNA glutamyl-Q(34) synthetase GluQRS [Arenimonas sp.]